MPLAVDMHVSWFDVAMNDPTLMQIPKSRRYLQSNTEGMGLRSQSAAIHDGAQRFAAQPFHDDVGTAAELAHVVGGDHVGVRATARKLSLQDEAAVDGFLLRVYETKDLDDHRTRGYRVPREKHVGHVAAEVFPAFVLAYVERQLRRGVNSRIHVVVQRTTEPLASQNQSVRTVKSADAFGAPVDNS